MTEQAQPKNPTQKLPPDRRVVVWTFVSLCIDRAGLDPRAADAQKLVRQQIRTASDEAGRD